MNAISAIAANAKDQAARDADYLRRAYALSDLIESQADACEEQGTLAAPLVDAFREAGLFWMQLPIEYGGGGVSLAGGIEVWEEISRADGSAGWSLMANGGQIVVAATFLGPLAFNAMFEGGKLPIMAGMLGPAGKGHKVPGGYVAGGKFAFASGAGHADWIGLGFVVDDDGAPIMLPDGTPAAKMAFVPRDAARMLGGWDVTGLVGTGSYDYEIPEQFIADDFTMDRVMATPLRGEAMFNVGPFIIGTAGHVAVALGLAKRALQEVVIATRGKKRPGYSGSVSDNLVFRNQFSIAEATYQATRALVLQTFAQAQAAVETGGALPDDLAARTRQAATWAHKTCSDVVRFAHEWGGAKSIRNPSVMGRVTRDMAVATQHAFVDPVTLTNAAGPIMQSWIDSVGKRGGTGR